MSKIGGEERPWRRRWFRQKAMVWAGFNYLLTLSAGGHLYLFNAAALTDRDDSGHEGLAWGVNRQHRLDVVAAAGLAAVDNVVASAHVLLQI
jgi:hypothetical protein